MPIGPNSPYTDLDYPQVLQRVFEEAEDRLRVDAEVTAVLGTVEVIVTDTNDSIKIGNGLGVFADVDVNRNLLVRDNDANTTLSSIYTALTTSGITVNQGTSPWVISGNTGRTWVLDDSTDSVESFQGGSWTTGRTWTLSSGTDSVNIGNFPATQSVTQGTTPWIVDGSGFTQPVSGTVTANQGTSPWIVSGTVAATQSGVWTTGRTWTLSSGTDSVASVQSGTWNIGTLSTITNVVHVDDNGGSLTVDGTVTALQGTSPWVISGTVTTSPNVNVHDGTGVSISSTGSSLNVNVTNTIPVSQSGTWTVTANQGTSPWVISGTVAATQSGAWTTGRTWTLSSGTDSVASVQSGTWVLGANSGVDIGDVTINNAAGASAVNIQDGGNSITVDGTVTVNQGTSPWVISGAVTLPYDTNYGTVGAATLRTASQIGNSTGQASFNYGTVGAQTLRVASQIGNATGAADFNAGTTGAQTLRTTANITRNGTELDYNYGTVGANTLRTASQIGNATGAADFNAGATGAQTLRVTANAGVNLNTSALALDTTVAALQVTQGSTTAGQSGTLIQGAVTTNAPTYTTGQTRPLSLTTGGALRVDEVGFSTAGNTRPAITNASSTVLAANLARKYVYISNQSGVVAYLKLGATAVINEGIRLPNNSIYEITKDNLWLGTIQAIKSGAASVNLDIFEGTP